MLKTYTWPRYAHQRPSELDTAAVRCVPLLANHIGDLNLLHEAVAAARPIAPEAAQ